MCVWLYRAVSVSAATGVSLSLSPLWSVASCSLSWITLIPSSNFCPVSARPAQVPYMSDCLRICGVNVPVNCSVCIVVVFVSRPRKDDLIMCTVIIMDIIIWPLLPCCYILCRFSIGIFSCMNGVFALLAKPTCCKLV